MEEFVWVMIMVYTEDSYVDTLVKEYPSEEALRAAISQNRNVECISVVSVDAYKATKLSI